MPSNCSFILLFFYSFILLTLLEASLSFDLARSPQPAARSPQPAARSPQLIAFIFARSSQLMT
jgi:hypothetical protein